MSIFNKLFGKGRRKEKQKASEILYPILKPGNWPGLPYAVWNKMVGTNENPDIVIAYGYDKGENFSFLTQQDIGKRSTLEVHKEALYNLRKLPNDISDGTVQLGEKIWTSSGNDFSAEKILDRDFLLEAHKKADSNLLWFSIPRRRCLMFCKAGLSDEFQKLFIQLHLHAWQQEEYGNALIANMIFEVRNGEIENAIDMAPNR